MPKLSPNCCERAITKPSAGLCSRGGCQGGCQPLGTSHVPWQGGHSPTVHSWWGRHWDGWRTTTGRGLSSFNKIKPMAEPGTGAFLLRTAVSPYGTDELRHQAISRASAQLCENMQTWVWTRFSMNRTSVRHSKAFNAPKSPRCPTSPPVNSTTPQENTFIRGFLPLSTLAIFLFPSVVLQQPGSLLWGRYMSK